MALHRILRRGGHSISLSIEGNGCGFNVKEILSKKILLVDMGSLR